MFNVRVAGNYGASGMKAFLAMSEKAGWFSVQLPQLTACTAHKQLILR
jgi:hypothetical protein